MTSKLAATTSSTAKPVRKPTIYAALAARLNRTPTNAELKAEVRRILREVTVELAGKGKLPHQRKGR